MGLPEPYRTVGIECVARRVVNDMCLHMLALIATFQEQAEQEDISQEDRKEALEHILPQIFQVLEDLNQYISVQSLDDLATLSSITASLWVLSETEMAEEARSRLYELPETYHQELAQENLLIDTSLIPDETRAPSQKRPIIFLRKDA